AWGERGRGWGPGGAREAPASAARPAKTHVKTRSMLTPRPAVISASHTPARTIAPSLVRSIKSQSATAIARPKAITKRRYDGMVGPRIVKGPENKAGEGIERG